MNGVSAQSAKLSTPLSAPGSWEFLLVYKDEVIDACRIVALTFFAARRDAAMEFGVDPDSPMLEIVKSPFEVRLPWPRSARSGKEKQKLVRT